MNTQGYANRKTSEDLFGIKDMFYSFQGEGPFIGMPQVFLRLYGCNIHCAYCDEPDFPHQKKNQTLSQVLEGLAPLIAKQPHSLSVTGGEPMIQTEALCQLLPHIPIPIYLETNGTLPEKLSPLFPYVSYYSVDYKPGFLEVFTQFIANIHTHKTGPNRFWEATPQNPYLFVKLVLTPGFSTTETLQLAQAVAGISPDIPFVIQPVTPFGTIQRKASQEDIVTNFESAKCYLRDVRVIGQTHKFIGVR